MTHNMLHVAGKYIIKINIEFIYFPFFVTAQTIDVIAVEGKSISLQCPIHGSDVAMVLWFKNGGGIPLYRYKLMSRVLYFFLFKLHCSISQFPRSFRYQKTHFSVLFTSSFFFSSLLFLLHHSVVFLLMPLIKDL